MVMSPPKTDCEVPDHLPLSTMASANAPSVPETYVIPGVVVAERFFTVPLDYFNASRGLIRIFARLCMSMSRQRQMDQLPFMVYLQGGPGMEASAQPPSNSGMLKVLMDRGYQVLQLDQRGTGLSTPISSATLLDKGDVETQVAYVKQFRADNIVRDCEVIRKTLLSHRDDKRWSILGQSFGGFCSMTYLSFLYSLRTAHLIPSPESLREVYITGGLAPMISQPEEVYVIERNRAYYAKFPYDASRVRDILTFLHTHPTATPNGGSMTPRRFQQLGIDFGAHGGFDRVHNLVLRTSNDLYLFQKITYKTLAMIQESNYFDSNVLYTVLHEPIYCQGHASNWAAERVMATHFPEFFWPSRNVETSNSHGPLFTGEMIFSWMFADYAELRPLAQVAEILAKERDWPPLYDESQLAKNVVPVAAATFVEDMYVDYELSKKAKEKIRGCQQWITNKYALCAAWVDDRYLHNGLRQDPVEVLGNLFNIIVNGTPH